MSGLVLLLMLTLAVSLGALLMLWKVTLVQRRELPRLGANASDPLDTAVRTTRRQMNDAAGQSWRNLAD